MECQTCRWWERTGAHAFGQCRRYPPQVTVDADTQPVTEAYDYCGEYAQAPADTTTSDT